MRAGEAHEVARACDDRSALRRAGNRDAAAAAKLEQAFVTELPECPQHGVGVDAEHGREVAGGRQPLARRGFAVGDGAADLGRDLLVQIGRLIAIGLPHADCSVGFDHRSDASDTSFIVPPVLLPPRGSELGKASAAPEPEALIREARRRQRRRRAATVAALLALAGIGAWLSTTSERGPGTRSVRHASPSRPNLGAATLRLELAGFGTPLPSEIDRGSCPQGRTSIAIHLPTPTRVGTLTECVLTVWQTRRPGGALVRISEHTSDTYALPDGTLATRESHSILFAADPRHTTAIFRGRVIGGSGRYAHARGTLSGGGPGIDGKARWQITMRLRP